MSADATTAVGPISVRYAAQIRELLFAQAMQRMAADQEAARASAQAERAARAEAARKPEPDPVRAKVETTPPAKTTEAKPETSPSTTAPAQIVDIHA